MAAAFQWIPDVPNGVLRNRALSDKMRYASIAQCEFEVRSAENLFHRHGIPAIDTTE